MKQLRLSVLAAALVLAAGCTASPTGTLTHDQAGARFDGGNMIGSGNSLGGDPAGPGMLGSGNTVPTDGGDPIILGARGDSTETGRGGNTTGSGN